MRILATYLLLAVSALLVSAALAVDTPGTLQLVSHVPTLLAGSFQKDGTSIDFYAQPSFLSLSSEQRVLFSATNYGAFTMLNLGDAKYLISEDGTVAVDISGADSLVLPQINTTKQYSKEGHLEFFRNVLDRTSDSALEHAESTLSQWLQDFLASQPAAALPYLSLKLAGEGIALDAVSTPLHGTAIRAMRVRGDAFDKELLAQVNALYIDNASASQEECTIVAYCGNDCFGMCGYGCECIEWWCGGCTCFLGCWNHDYCCSCKGMTSLCCLDVFTWKCDGS